MTNGEIFRKAADYIREHGHWKGFQPEPDHGQRCIGLAIAEIAGFGATDPVRAAAKRVTGTENCSALYEWNDVPERTIDEVCAVLDGLAFDEDLKSAATADNPASGVMAWSNPVEQTHDSAIIPSLEAVPVG